jgi:hypothetical protein
MAQYSGSLGLQSKWLLSDRKLNTEGRLAVRMTVSGDDRLRLFRIVAHHSVAGARCRALADVGVFVVGVEQRKIERLGNVDSQKAAR